MSNTEQRYKSPLTAPPEEPRMNATARKLIARTRDAIRTAVTVSRAARYAILNGRAVTEQLASGQLIQASTYLRTVGLNEQGVRSFRSHYGKKVKAAHRATTGRDPLMAWVLIDERWMRVCVYQPSDAALRAGVTAYPRLAAVVEVRTAEFARCA